MKLELLQQIYNLFAKYHKAKWSFKREETLLGKKITMIYVIDNFLTNFTAYGNNEGLMVEETKLDKAATKFFDEIELATGQNFDDFEFIREVYYDVESEICDEFRFFRDLKLSKEMMNYIYNLFVVGGKLQSWKNVEKIYNPNFKIKVTSIRVGDYDAILTKGKPVKVGCQSIQIDTIRALVKAYDEL